MPTPFDDQRRAYDDAYNTAEAEARRRNARFFEAPAGSPDYLDITKRMNPVRPLDQVPWQVDRPLQEQEAVPRGTASAPEGTVVPATTPVASLQPQPKPMAIEDHLKQQSLATAMFGRVDANNIPIPSPDTEPTQPVSDSHVRVTVGGKTYEYGGGKEGGAPTLAAQQAAQRGNQRYVPEGRVGGFGTHWKPAAGGGTVSMMTDNPNLTPERSIEAALNARRVADAQPAEGDLGRRGFNAGEAREFDAARLRGGRSIEDAMELRQRQADLSAASQAKQIEALEKELGSRHQEIDLAGRGLMQRLYGRRAEFGSLPEFEAEVAGLKRRIRAAKLEARNDLMWQIGIRPPSGEDMAAELAALGE